jgi:uncharacterized lipoprotein YddW (UPF0748 family)
VRGGGAGAHGPAAAVVTARRALAAALLLGALGAACTRVGTRPPPAEPRQGPIGTPIPDAPERVAAPGPPPSAPPPQPAGTSRASARFDEVRGLWVVRFSLATPESARAVVERAAAAGFNTLLVQARGRGDAYYQSALEPSGFSGPASFDPLAEIVAAAHARGIAVHAWVNVSLVADATTVPSDPRHLARAHPEALMVPRALVRPLARFRPGDPRYADRLIEWTRENRERVEGLYVSPASLPVRERTVAVALDLAGRYDLDGVHFDYIRYPAPDFDYSEATLEAFRDWAVPLVGADRRRQLDRAASSNPTAWPDSLPMQWGDFRRQQVTTLLERAYVALKTVRPWLIVSAAVHPDPNEARRGRMQDWPGWARAGLLDAVAPMAYTSDRRVFRAQLEGAIEAAPGTEMWAGIGSYLAGLQGTVDALATARALGTHGIMLFSYDWAVSEDGGAREAFLQRVGRSLRAR